MIFTLKWIFEIFKNCSDNVTIKILLNKMRNVNEDGSKNFDI